MSTLTLSSVAVLQAARLQLPGLVEQTRGQTFGIGIQLKEATEIQYFGARKWNILNKHPTAGGCNTLEQESLYNTRRGVSTHIDQQQKAEGCNTLEPAQLSACTTYIAHPNIPDGNFNLVHHFICDQIFQINKKGTTWIGTRWTNICQTRCRLVCFCIVLLPAHHRSPRFSPFPGLQSLYLMM